MPSFRSYVETDVDVDIDVEEFIEHCSKEDVEEIISLLVDGGDILPSAVPTRNANFHDERWSENLEKLRLNRLSLTNEEIELIEKIATRF
jgi:hypothetical protein